MTESWPTFHDLMSAYKNCCLHKTASRSQIQFEAKLGESLSILHEQISSNQYCPAPTKYFVVTHPKPREIFASDFRDRVVHHLIVSQLELIWEKKFIYSSFACRVRKGSHGAIKYAQLKVRELSQGGTKTIWALQLDVEKFFVTINRPILCQLLLKHSRQPKLRELILAIYNHDARVGAKKSGDISNFNLIKPGRSWFDQLPDQGIPIGNLSSQFAANVTLTGLDHFIQRELKPKAYLRYMDDLLLFDPDKERLQVLAKPINHWLQTNRNQRLNPSKTHLTQLPDGITYLGYHLKQRDSSSEPLQVFSQASKKWQWIQSLRKIEKASFSEPKKPHPLAPLLNCTDLDSQLASLNAKLGTLTHSKTYILRKKSLDTFIRNTTIFQKVPKEFADRWCPFKIKKDYRAIRHR